LQRTTKIAVHSRNSLSTNSTAQIVEDSTYLLLANCSEFASDLKTEPTLAAILRTQEGTDMSISMSRVSRVAIVASLALVWGLLPLQHASAEIKSPSVKIGVLSVFAAFGANYGGDGSLVAAQMAIEDFGGTVNGKPIELVWGDTLQKPDVASNLARQWFDRDNVDVIVDVPNSAVALSVLEIARERNKVVLISQASAKLLTGARCAPTVINWVFDTYNLAVGSANAVRGLSSAAKKDPTFFFIQTDFSFARDLTADFTAAVEKHGGKVLGVATHPLNTPDLSAQLLQAQKSRANYIILANGPPDQVTAIKQAREFGIPQGGQQIIPLLIAAVDIKSLGLPVAQGTVFNTGFYPDRDDQTRSWTKRYYEKRKEPPNEYHAGVYSSVIHYLKAVKEVDSTDGPTVIAKMREMPVKDILAKDGKIRPDNRLSYTRYMLEVKAPNESKEPWDFYKLAKEVSPEEGYRSISESDCSLVQK
jgi:branched-chain amino acid transport system substrate-binding protein